MLSLGIDVGTSGVRSAVVEGTTLVSEARASHPPQDPNHIDARKWWDAVEDCLAAQIAALIEKGRSPKEIAGIAVDGTSGTMVLTDKAIRPVGPALMYNSKGFDAEAQLIASLTAGPHITKGSNSALARAMRLCSMAEAEPHHLLHQADFIAAKLCGHAAGSDHNNALKTGYDPETNSWPDWADQVIAPSLLPSIVAPGTPIGVIAPEVADRLGLSLKTQIHAGTTDSIAAFLAASPIELGNAVTSLGSTLAVKLLSDNRIDDPDIGLYSHRLGAYWLVGGASNTGGAVLRTFFDDAALVSLSNQIDPSVASDLDYYPLLSPGERFPINDPALPPRLAPRPSDDAAFLHGLLESIARIEASCYQKVQARGANKPKQVLTAGGGAKNSVWRAIRSRHLGVEPTVAQFDDAAYGAALLVAPR